MFSREFKAGVLVVLAAAVLYWGISFLKGSDLFEHGTEVYAVYDNAEGITKSQSVTLNGFSVGKVSDVYFHPNHSGKIVVKMNITTDYPITANSLAEIRSADLLGAKEIALVLEKGSVLIESGDTLRSAIEASLSESINKEVIPVKVKAEKLLASLDSTVNILTGFLGGEMQEEFRTSFDNVNRSISNLGTITDELSLYMSENREALGSATQNLERLTSMLNENRDELDRVFNNLANISDTLARANAGEAMRSLSKTATRLDAITSNIEAGEGTLGKLVANDSLYNEINHAILSLDKLLEDIKERPGRYVEISIFGGKNKDTKTE
ncbi:MAG: MCE family protein [Flavobacteriia bacterium]|jgi:phospholipid/cholesterol/gamma-HCH transport system substrate-binding protein|nr:MCE family protein [Flavobacteriia bacterium]NDH90689.1 MCE family protein [Flavobacteriia bacterium]